MQLFVQFRYLKKKKKNNGFGICVMLCARTFFSSNCFFLFIFSTPFCCYFHRLYFQCSARLINARRIIYNISMFISFMPPATNVFAHFFFHFGFFFPSTNALTADYEWLKLCSFHSFHFICSDSFLHLHFHIFDYSTFLTVIRSFLFWLFSRFSLWFCIECICDSVKFFSCSYYFYSQYRHLFKISAAHRFAYVQCESSSICYLFFAFSFSWYICCCYLKMFQTKRKKTNVRTIYMHGRSALGY